MEIPNNRKRRVSESTENILKVLEPIINIIKSYSRPTVTPFKFRHGRKGVVRIASWNIERFDEEKANNPGVKEVVCMTILDNGTSWQVAVCSIRCYWEDVPMSVHPKATGLDKEDIERLQNEIDKVSEVIDAIEKQYPGKEDVIMLGDFNLDPKMEDFDIMREKGYSNCVPVGEFTNISNSNPEGSQIYDHIWISSRTNKAFSGNSGVIERENLTSPLIPNEWSL
ncbi:unnamed protein product [Mytilus edulis]|uniref:Endonuclease/exonuclease/phosphatase domain-containing protein n=1 Tax=Mytilus edulis TaxID=6550 RepID=A0A8S3RFG6_MYTED|nr:unnamed protein product [Mytilus edulis]